MKSKVQSPRSKVGAWGIFARWKAALKRPHSKRSARDEALDAARQCLECSRFSAALASTSPRRQPWTLDLGLWTLLLAASVTAAEIDPSKLPPASTAPVNFARDIRPIFENSCLRCHGAEKPKGRFSLATREAALRGGHEGIDIIPGDSAKSPLIHYIARLVPEMEMPPEGKGDPLTRAQVALLRAWIDQGATWEKLDPDAIYAAQQPQFSFTPAVRYVTVSGNARQFQEHQWVRRGFTAGASDFRVTQKRGDGVNVIVEGRALTDDYKVTLDLRKPDEWFARGGFEMFRRYDNDNGPSYPFRASGFSTPVRNIYSLDDDLETDLGKVFIEFGLTRPDWPRAVLGYELHFKHGDEATQQWGPVTQATSGGPVTRNIYPARREVDEETHVVRLDVSHEIAGARVENNLRAEFSDLETTRANAVEFPPGAAYPSAFTLTRESQDQVLFANALHGEKSLKDWLLVSAGYLFSHFRADATFDQTSVDGAGRPAAGNFWSANDIVLKESAHVLNANVLAGPWAGFTAALGVLSEWSEHTGYGDANYRSGDPNDPSVGVPDAPGLVRSDIDRTTVEEQLTLRYTTIPMTALFAEARWKQERSGKFEEQFGGDDFLRDTDARIDGQNYRAGFHVSPLRWAALHASYQHRRHESDYDDARDEQPHGSPGDGYPAHIRARQSVSDLVEARLTLRPATWLRTMLSYQLGETDYHTTTDPTRTIGAQAPGGTVYAGQYDFATYSANVTITPARRWSFATTLSYQPSRTRTEDQGSAAVATYRGDLYSVMTRATYAAGANTDLSAGYNFSTARFGQHQAAGTPLGMDYDLHGVQFGVSHRLNTNTVVGAQYGFYHYEEPTAQGFNDYTAHVIFATLAVRWP